MTLGKVVGTVVATRKEASMDGLKLMVVKTVDPEGKETGGHVVAADAVGVGPGELVDQQRPVAVADQLVDQRYGMTRHALQQHAPDGAIFAVSSYGLGATDNRPPVELQPLGLEGPLAAGAALDLQPIDRGAWAHRWAIDHRAFAHAAVLEANATLGAASLRDGDLLHPCRTQRRGGLAPVTHVSVLSTAP